MNVNDQFLDTNGDIDKTRVLTFFKDYSVTTSSGLGNAGQMPTISKGNIRERSDAFSGTGSEKAIRGGVFDAQVIQFNVHKTDSGEVEFQRAGGSDENTIGAYYLPWGGMYVMSMKLPAEPEADFFFTSGLVGCSVFASGEPSEPTVYHAGTEGSYAGDVTAFWQECIQAAARGQGLTDLDSLKGINKTHYLQNPYCARFERWLRNELEKTLDVEHSASGGFVFGVRDGDDWEFYLQDRLVVETIEFVKKSDTAQAQVHPLAKGSIRERDRKQTQMKGLFKKRPKEVVIGCEIVRKVSHPVSLRQFFPAGTFNVNLVDKWKLGD